jgi:hypothetical protein
VVYRKKLMRLAEQEDYQPSIKGTHSAFSSKCRE